MELLQIVLHKFFSSRLGLHGEYIYLKDIGIRRTLKLTCMLSLCYALMNKRILSIFYLNSWVYRFLQAQDING